MTHTTAIVDDTIVHRRDEDGLSPLTHPHDAEWVWTRCCGLIAYQGKVLDPPVACPQPLVSPEAFAAVRAMVEES